MLKVYLNPTFILQMATLVLITTFQTSCFNAATKGTETLASVEFSGLDTRIDLDNSTLQVSYLGTISETTFESAKNTSFIPGNYTFSATIKDKNNTTIAATKPEGTKLDNECPPAEVQLKSGANKLIIKTCEVSAVEGEENLKKDDPLKIKKDADVNASIEIVKPDLTKTDSNLNTAGIDLVKKISAKQLQLSMGQIVSVANISSFEEFYGEKILFSTSDYQSAGVNELLQVTCSSPTGDFLKVAAKKNNGNKATLSIQGRLKYLPGRENEKNRTVVTIDLEQCIAL